MLGYHGTPCPPIEFLLCFGATGGQTSQKYWNKHFFFAQDNCASTSFSNQRLLFIWQCSYIFVLLLCILGHAKMCKSSYWLLSRLLKCFTTSVKVPVLICFCPIYPAKMCIFNASAGFSLLVFTLSLLRGLFIIGQQACMIVQVFQKIQQCQYVQLVFLWLCPGWSKLMDPVPNLTSSFPFAPASPPKCAFSQKKSLGSFPGPTNVPVSVFLLPLS